MTKSMTNEPFGRQPQPVLLTAVGDQRDIDFYLDKIKRIIETGSHDNVVRTANQLRIHPRAIND